MTHNAKIHSVITFALFVLSVCLLVTLIAERSRDTVRVTVPYGEVLTTAQQLQGITHKVAYAYPVNKAETMWRVVIDKKSERNTK